MASRRAKLLVDHVSAIYGPAIEHVDGSRETLDAYVAHGAGDAVQVSLRDSTSVRSSMHAGGPSGSTPTTP